MYITYVSYSTRSFLNVHALNKYHHQNNLMISYSSRGIIPKNRNCFYYGPENERKVDILGWNQSSVLPVICNYLQPHMWYSVTFVFQSVMWYLLLSVVLLLLFMLHCGAQPGMFLLYVIWYFQTCILLLDKTFHYQKLPQINLGHQNHHYKLKLRRNFHHLCLSCL